MYTSPVSHTFQCLARFILLDLIIRMLFVEVYRFLASLLCSLLHSKILQYSEQIYKFDICLT